MNQLETVPQQVQALFAQPLSSRRRLKFRVEAELDELVATIERIEVRRPELFRETERCRDLIDRIDALVDDEQPA